jgi:hypothetical protein
MFLSGSLSPPPWGRSFFAKRKPSHAHDHRKLKLTRSGFNVAGLAKRVPWEWLLENS